MRRSLLPVLIGLGCVAPANLFAEASVGSKAPRLEPQEWLNTQPAMSWSKLKGRVVLVEKWRTT